MTPRGSLTAAQTAVEPMRVTHDQNRCVVLVLLGGLLAGAVGGWRASRLRPAEALRSVA